MIRVDPKKVMRLASLFFFLGALGSTYNLYLIWEEANNGVRLNAFASICISLTFGFLIFYFSFKEDPIMGLQASEIEEVFNKFDKGGNNENKRRVSGDDKQEGRKTASGRDRTRRRGRESSQESYPETTTAAT